MGHHSHSHLKMVVIRPYMGHGLQHTWLASRLASFIEKTQPGACHRSRPYSHSDRKVSGNVLVSSSLLSSVSLLFK